MRRVLTAVVVAAMMVLPGCGRQLPLGPDGNGIVQSGQTLIRFETAGQLDFQNVSYLMVFNTSGKQGAALRSGVQHELHELVGVLSS